MKILSPRHLLCFATIAAGLLAIPSAQAAQPGVNLLVNGNAEAGAFSATGAPVVVPGWTTSSAFTVVNYKPAGDTSGFPKVTDPGPPDRGNQFFAGGNAATSTAAQTIDVTANAADIDTGKALADLSGWVGGYATDNDYASLSVAFFNGNTNLGGFTATTNPVNANARGSITSLLFRSQTGGVPVNTRQIVVTLTMTRTDGAFNDGYADSLSLVLRVPMVVTTTADSGAGSLRVILPAASVITFDSNVFAASNLPHVIDLLSALPVLYDVTITGPGANILTVRRSSAASAPFRIFSIPQLSVARISGLTIANGRAALGGGILVQSATVILNNCTITANMSDKDGGGIYSDGSDFQSTNCLFANNTAPNGSGGAIYNNAGVELNGCTFSANTAQAGAAVYSIAAGTGSNAAVNASNCTFTGNIASTAAGGGINNAGNGSPKVVLHACTFNGNSGLVQLGQDSQSSASITFDNTIFTSSGNNFLTPSFPPRAVVTSAGYNLSSRDDSLFLNKTGDRNNTDPMLDTLRDNGGQTPTHALLPGSPAIDKGNSSLTTDQRGFTRPVDDPNSASGGGNNSDIGAFEVQLPTPTPTPTPIPTQLANISTRLPVGTGDNVLIAGFIVTGNQNKKVIVRAIGPSLTFAGKLADPILELHDGSGALLEMNDNWMDSPNKQAIIDSTIPPSNPLESAIVRSVPPGNYTAIERGVNNGTGIGVIEAYDLDTSANAKLANISTRGLVQAGDNVLFAGMIVVGQTSQKVIIRALGPSTGVPGALADPTLELRDQNGGLLEANDNWMDSPNKQAIIDSTIPPPNNAESAIVRTLSPASYTAIVRGVNNTTGIAVVEVYGLQ